MKLNVQYVNDAKGNIQAVQLALPEWNKLIARLRKYEQKLKMKADLTEAFEELAFLKKSTTKKQPLSELLNEL